MTDNHRNQNVAMPDVEGVRHRTIDLPDLSVHVAEAGADESVPIIMLHGWPQNWYCWRHIVDHFASTAQFRLLMPDLRGHGWTEAPCDGYDKEQLADDLLGVMDALGLDQVGLVGHDWGGWVGFLACLKAPERFTGFVALGIVHPFQQPTPARLAQAWRAAYQVALATPLLAEYALRSSSWPVATAISLATSRDVMGPEVRNMYARTFQHPERARATVQMYRTFLTREIAHLGRYLDERLEVPTHLIVGDQDPIASPTLLDGWQDYADEMKVTTLDGIGHFIPEEAPSAVVEAILNLFGSTNLLCDDGG